MSGLGSCGTPPVMARRRGGGEGKIRKKINVIFQVSEATVRTHLEHLYAKLGVTNRVEAASIAPYGSNWRRA